MIWWLKKIWIQKSTWAVKKRVFKNRLKYIFYRKPNVAFQKKFWLKHIPPLLPVQRPMSEISDFKIQLIYWIRITKKTRAVLWWYNFRWCRRAILRLATCEPKENFVNDHENEVIIASTYERNHSKQRIKINWGIKDAFLNLLAKLYSSFPEIFYTNASIHSKNKINK